MYQTQNDIIRNFTSVAQSSVDFVGVFREINQVRNHRFNIVSSPFHSGVFEIHILIRDFDHVSIIIDE